MARKRGSSSVTEAVSPVNEIASAIDRVIGAPMPEVEVDTPSMITAVERVLPTVFNPTDP